MYIKFYSVISYSSRIRTYHVVDIKFFIRYEHALLPFATLVKSGKIYRRKWTSFFYTNFYYTFLDTSMNTCKITSRSEENDFPSLWSHQYSVIASPYYLLTASVLHYRCLCVCVLPVSSD